jgi:hypothetical protein
MRRPFRQAMQPTQRTQALVQLFGILAGFLAAVAAGHWAVRLREPANFQRFHPQISAETSFFPPFSLMENLALEHWEPGRTVVLIGGNSVLNGVSQPADALWSRDLQELLGPRFVVVNFALRSASISEGAAVVAEALVRRGVPVIYVANTWPGFISRAYDGTYAYLFWDALAQDRLLPHAPRVERLHEVEQAPPSVHTDEMSALKLGARLNAVLRFQELWHHVAYRYFFTVWSEQSRAGFLSPKDGWPDLEPPPEPLADRFQSRPAADIAAEVQDISEHDRTLIEPNGVGGWRLDDQTLLKMDHDIEEILAPPLRTRMVLLLIRNCPFYLDRLPPPARARNNALFSAYEKVWLEHGVNCVVAGSDFQDADYADRNHLTASGGRKLAQVVADLVRPMAP